jgi:hypothetical protein
MLVAFFGYGIGKAGRNPAARELVFTIEDEIWDGQQRAPVFRVG